MMTLLSVTINNLFAKTVKYFNGKHTNVYVKNLSNELFMSL